MPADLLLSSIFRDLISFGVYYTTYAKAMILILSCHSSLQLCWHIERKIKEVWRFYFHFLYILLKVKQLQYKNKTIHPCMFYRPSVEWAPFGLQSARDHFIFFFWGGGGGTHILVRFARILKIHCPNPSQRWKSCEGLYFSVGLGVHEIIQVIPAKIIEEQKHKKKKNLCEFFPRFARILPKFAWILLEIFRNSYIGNLFIYFVFIIIIFFLGGGGQMPPVSYAYGLGPCRKRLVMYTVIGIFSTHNVYYSSNSKTSIHVSIQLNNSVWDVGPFGPNVWAQRFLKEHHWQFLWL